MDQDQTRPDLTKRTEPVPDEQRGTTELFTVEDDHGSQTGATAADLPPGEPRGVRVGTVVWGLVIAAIGCGILAFAAGAVFDVELALIVLVTAAGVALLAGSLVTTARRRRT